MKKVMLAATLFTSLCSGHAFAQRVGQPIVVERPAEQIDAERVVPRDQPLLVQMAHSRKQVRLLSAAATGGSGQAASAAELPSGSILYEASKDGSVYCSPMDWQSAGYCLEDINMDGAFEVEYRSHNNDRTFNYFSFDNAGDVETAVFQKPKKLSNAVPYEVVGGGPFMAGPIRIKLETNFVGRSAFHPFKARLIASFGIAGLLSAQGDYVMIDPSNVTRTSIMGAIIDITGYDARGDIHYKIVRSIPTSIEQFVMEPAKRY